MKKFFSRAELIHLARRSDYIGATISQPRPWTRRSTSTSLFSLKNLQDQLSNDKLVAISQLNLEDSIMMSPRESMLRSSAAPFPNPSNYPGLSATSMIGGNGSFSARKEESYDPRYQNYGRTPVNTAASVGMNMGSFIDQAPGGGYSRYHGENLNQGFTGAPSPRTYGNNLPPRSIPTTNPAMYSSNPIKDMSSRYGNSNPHFRSSPSGDSYSSGQSNYYQPPTRAPSYGNGFPSGGIPIPPTVGIDQGKRPIVPPIPLQGLNGPGSNSYSNGMPSPHDGGNWSQRSNNGMWPSNAEATFVDRYGNNHGSSSLPNTARSDFNPANSIAANNYYARSSKMGESNVSPMLSARSAESEAFGDYFSNNAQPTYRNSNPTSANTSFYSNNTEGFGFDASNVQSYSARSVQSIPQVMSARSNYSSHGNSFREPISGGSSGRGSGAWDINESVAAKPWPAGNNFDLREESPKSSMNLNNTAPSTNESLYDNLSPQSWLTYGNATSQAVGGGSNNGKFWSATSDFSVLDGEENKSRVILGSANGGALDSLSYHNSAAPNNGANSNANNQATINSNRYY